MWQDWPWIACNFIGSSLLLDMFKIFYSKEHFFFFFSMKLLVEGAVKCEHAQLLNERGKTREVLRMLHELYICRGTQTQSLE